MSDVEKGKPGATFDEFLRDQGTYDETTERALKRVLAFQLEQAMKAQNISKKAMAERLETSRSQLDRLLDPANHTGISLAMLSRAAQVVGRTLKVDLI
jgi:plasmid maintenance system antidote protein VapI